MLVRLSGHLFSPRMLSLKLACFCLLPLLLLSGNLAGAPVYAQPAQSFHYAYVQQEAPGGYILRLINPADPSPTAVDMPLSLPPGNTIAEASASPNGEWIDMIVGEQGTFYIYLMNMLTGETRKVIPISIIGKVIWSPDSRYLAFNATDAQTPSPSLASYIYTIGTSIETSDLTYVTGGSKDIAPYDLIWSHDGSQLAVASRHCLQNSCQGLIQIFDIPAGTLHTSTDFNTFGDIMCGFTWSPDGRYLTFIFSCGSGIGMSLSPYISDVFTWDTKVHHIARVTTFTQIVSSSENIDPLITFAGGYDLIWYDSQHLLISLSSGRFRDAIGFDYNTLQLRTTIYHPDGSSKKLSDYLFGSWVLNPVFQELALIEKTLVHYIPSDSNMQLLKPQDATVQIATFDGASLHISHTGPAGCDLSWSPDGAILAYTNRGIPFDTCGDLVQGFIFIDRVTGQISQYPASDPYLVGWVAVPTNRP